MILCQSIQMCNFQFSIPYLNAQFEVTVFNCSFLSSLNEYSKLKFYIHFQECSLLYIIIRLILQPSIRVCFVLPSLSYVTHDILHVSWLLCHYENGKIRSNHPNLA